MEVELTYQMMESIKYKKSKRVIMIGKMHSGHTISYKEYANAKLMIFLSFGKLWRI
jgi:hypothetical protein